MSPHPRFERKIMPLQAMDMLFGMSQAVFAFRVLFLQTYGLNATAAGVVLCLASIIGAFTPSIGGLLADKFRSKHRVFIICLAGSAVVTSFVPLSATVNFVGTILAVILVPMMTIFMPPCMNMLESSSVNATYHYPGTEYSHLRIFMSLGFTVANLLYTPLVKLFGINSIFYVCLFYYVSLLLLSGTLRQFETTPGEIPEEALGAKPVRQLNVSRILKNYYLTIFLVINIAFSMSQSCNSFISYLLQKLHIEMAMTGVAAGIRVVGELIVLLLLPQAKKRLSLPLLQILACCLFMAEQLLYPVCRSIVAIVFVEILGGMGWGIAIGSAILYVRSMAPRGLETSTISFWTAGTSIGGVIAMLVCGRIIDTSGIYGIYRFAFFSELFWLAVFAGSYGIGKYMLHIEPPVSLLPIRKPQTGIDQNIV